VTERILITGAAGGVGTLMRPRLAAGDRILRLLDIGEQPAAAAGEQAEILRASVTDLAAMEKACEGVDAVIHLGGHSLEQVWSEILEVNINGTYMVLEAARRQGVKRVILATTRSATSRARTAKRATTCSRGRTPTTASARSLSRRWAACTPTGTAWT
jgi:nucleoside-diphosphate-sugar epimerase